MKPIPFGPFQLTAQLDAGGMGEVWEGLHVQQQVPVAVKLISGGKIDDERFRDAFVNEVRAVAGLNHPGIPMVLDFGEVPDDVEVATKGRIVARAPYLVMELLSGGSLKQRLPAPNWEWVKTILFSLLDTLAYAHARGVLHRDIKPANILFAGNDKNALKPKLIDFGLATLWQAEQQERPLAGGTPVVQAPEQIVPDRIRDQGPWTDLYSLGCLTFAMVCGRYPYEGRHSKDTLGRHLTHRIPALTPVFPVPDGLNIWVRQMIAKSPKDRFRRAADAAQSLRRLGEAYSEVNPWISNVPTTARTTRPTVFAEFYKEREASIESATETMPHKLADSAAELDRVVGQPSETPRPCILIPDDWRRSEPQRPSMQLVGAGLRLYGLRRIPVVDREEERSALWQTLTDVWRQRKTRIVLLDGPAGTGKSRLAEWLCTRAHEVGVATSLKAIHSPHSSPGEGLARMFDRFLDCVGLSRDKTQQRIERLLNERGDVHPFTQELLLDFLRPSETASSRDSANLVSVRSYHSALLEILRLYAERRCLLIWYDDVQWGSAAIAFAKYVIDSEADEQHPILFLMTVQDEALVERELESVLLDELRDRPETKNVSIGPLRPPFRAQLINELLNIEGELAERVDKRTRGNPLFAVQLVGDWVGRGVLDIGQTGFTLRPGEEAVVPDDVYAVWHTRVRRVFENSVSQHDGAEEDPLIPLELAAVLGQDVDQEEWLELCKRSSTTVPPRLVDGLCTSRLAERTETGWRFVHNMLRESMERYASEAGRLNLHHLGCARMLQDRHSQWQLGVNERIAQHLLASGRLEEAVQPLTRATSERLRFGDLHATDRLIQTTKRIIESLQLPLNHPAHLRAMLIEIKTAVKLGRDLAFFGSQIDTIIESAESCSDANCLPEALFALALLENYRGRLQQARQLLKRAFDAAVALDPNHRSAAKSLWLLGEIEMRQGNLERSREYLDTCHNLAAAANDLVGQASALLLKGRIAASSGDLDTAFAYSQKSLEIRENNGDRLAMAQCLSDLGDYERYRGNLDEAARYQTQALEISMAYSPERAGFFRLNLTLVLIRQGRFQEALELLDKILRRARAADQSALVTCATSVLLPTLAGAERWEDFAESCETAKQRLAVSGIAEFDCAESLELAGDLAAAAEKPSHAKAVYALALDLWQKLKNEEREQRVRRAMNALA